MYPEEGGAPQHQAAYALAERAARRIFFYQPTLIHAVLQTPEYARALLALPGGPSDQGASTDQIDLMIAERMRRSSILFEPGRDLTILIGQAALLNQVAPPAVMRDSMRTSSADRFDPARIHRRHPVRRLPDSAAPRVGDAR